MPHSCSKCCRALEEEDMVTRNGALSSSPSTGGEAWKGNIEAFGFLNLGESERENVRMRSIGSHLPPLRLIVERSGRI